MIDFIIDASIISVIIAIVIMCDRLLWAKRKDRPCKMCQKNRNEKNMTFEKSLFGVCDLCWQKQHDEWHLNS